jgi:RNA polymerase sigma-70 factor (ECF subfamily)
VAAGDQRSFGQLYERFSGVLFSTAYRVLNDPEAAEDVRQDVFLQIWEKAPLYDADRGKPLTWAMTLTRNKAIDRLRGIQRRARLGEALKCDAATDEKFDDRDSFHAVDLTEQKALVRAALTKLGDHQRAALELAFFKGMTQTEIAKHLQEPLGTVKARVRRGLIRLRSLLDSPL